MNEADAALGEPSLFRYAAFISYSSRDAGVARRLHRALETYRIPDALGRFEISDEPKLANRIAPCFRDREEMPSGLLSAEIERALRDSSALIVVCTPAAAQSAWVSREIEYFIELGRGDRVFAIIADGRPHATSAQEECLPALLRAGEGTGEIVAGDCRRSGDGFHTAMLRLVSGVARIPMGRLIDRDRNRRLERVLYITAASIASVAVLASAFGVQDTLGARGAIARDAADIGVRSSILDGDRMWLAATPPTGALIGDLQGHRRALAESALGAYRASRIERLGEFSKDGERLVLQGARNRVQLLNAHTGQLIAELGAGAGEFVGDGRRIVFTDTGDDTTLMDGFTGAAIAPMGKPMFVSPVGIGRHLTTAEGSRHEIRDLETGALLWRAANEEEDLLLSPDGERVLVRSHRWQREADGDFRGVHRLVLRDARSGRLLRDIGDALEFQWSADGAILVQSDLHRWRLFDRDGGDASDARGYNDFGYSPTRRFAYSTISTTTYPTITLLNGQTLEPIATYERSSAPTFAPDEQTFFIGVVDKELRRTSDGGLIAELGWDSRTGRGSDYDPDPRDPLTGQNDTEFRSIHYSSDSRRIIIGTGDASFRLVDTQTGVAIANYDNVGALGAFSEDGSRFVFIRNSAAREVMSYRPDFQTRDMPDTIVQSLPVGGAPEIHDSADGSLVARIGAADAWRISSDARAAQVFLGDEQVLLFDLREKLPAPGRADAICRANRDTIGEFPGAQRLSEEGGYRTLASHLRGRPWNPCDWRGLVSPSGWAQYVRRLLVTLGVDWDYRAGECTRFDGFGCPRTIARVALPSRGEAEVQVQADVLRREAVPNAAEEGAEASRRPRPAPITIVAPQARASDAGDVAPIVLPFRWPGAGRSVLTPRDGEDPSAVFFDNPVNAQVHAVAAGEVVFSDFEPDGGFVRIEHADGLVTEYGYLGNLIVVTGDRVNAGDVLGPSDGRGRLLFRVRRDGEIVAPTSYFEGG